MLTSKMSSANNLIPIHLSAYSHKIIILLFINNQLRRALYTIMTQLVFLLLEKHGTRLGFGIPISLTLLVHDTDTK